MSSNVQSKSVNEFYSGPFPPGFLYLNWLCIHATLIIHLWYKEWSRLMAKYVNFEIESEIIKLLKGWQKNHKGQTCSQRGTFLKKENPNRSKEKYKPHIKTNVGGNSGLGFPCKWWYLAASAISLKRAIHFIQNYMNNRKKICLAHSKNENSHLASRRSTDRFFFFLLLKNLLRFIQCKLFYTSWKGYVVWASFTYPWPK